jgi:polar amino acid transport system substrate-binding protein
MAWAIIRPWARPNTGAGGPKDRHLVDRITLIGVLMVWSAACTPPPNPSASPGTHLAPGGTLRAGINLGNPVLAVRDPASGQLRGVAIDIGRELAARVKLPLRFVTYDSASRMAEEARSDAWDLAFLGADPAREADITFTAPYLLLEATYLVPAGSRLQMPADVDASGVRIAARPRSAYDLALRRIITRAQLVYPEAGETDVDLLTSGRADALASLRDVLVTTATSVPGSRVLDGHFATIAQAIGVPKGRESASAYLEDFLATIKKNGVVAGAIRHTGALGASAAP